ncbi:MAG: metalloregulator ArsR/SmtB family transcription factor [Rothia mucilaginosa]|uniref:metalloregulator ArsR/SmtB family transcription factor n=1 Tax=Rothia mucilaginosa TaxID=43675 RepID=UPI001DF8AE45|nr:metalloregulator ArsR/SmtB family transcription factor [Rothia mucilaginosa]MBS6433160.1 metalloregulator ArsR/SmtB family transcription factor [Rothia mucilaginosa]
MHSDVFSVIADPTRRRIVRILAEQTHTVGAVVEKLGMSQPTISKHLKVLRDADVVSVTVEGQRRLYSLNPEVFATVTEWINETVQIALRASEAPVALPGGATLSSERAPDEKAEVAPTSVTEPGVEKAPEKVAESQTAETPKEKPAEQSVAEAQPTAEELEQERIRRARAQYITPTARIIARPAHPASADASSPAVANAATRDAESRTESVRDSAVPAIAAHEDAVDSTPMRPFTPASYGYDVGRTARPEAQAVPPASAESAKAEEKPVDKAESPAVTVSSGYGFDSASSYGIDPAAVVGGSVQPIVEENVAEENTAEEGSSGRSEEATVAAPAVEPAEDSAENREATEEAPEQVEGSEETPEESESVPVEPVQSEPEYQTMPAYNSAYAPVQEPKEKEHRGGLFGFLRGRRR